MDRLLWFGSKGKVEASSAWFRRGIPRYIAGQILLSLGALNSEEYAVELNRLGAVVASSPYRELATAALPNTWAGMQLAEARGALHAAWVDEQLLRASKGARSLQYLLGALVAGGSDGQLSLTAWTQAIAQTLGATSTSRAVDAQIITGKDLRLPTNSFGPCFAAVTRTYAALQLGFDTSAVGGQEVVSHVDQTSAARHAGLQLGDEILHSQSSAGPKPVTHVTTRRQGQESELAFPTEYKNATGQGWQRRSGPPEAACAKRL